MLVPPVSSLYPLTFCYTDRDTTLLLHRIRQPLSPSSRPAGDSKLTTSDDNENDDDDNDDEEEVNDVTIW